MLACLLLGAPLLARAAELPPDLGQRLVQGYIAPATQTLARAAHGLHDELRAWCATRAPQGVPAVRARFAETVAAWSAVEFLRFGPLVAANRYERFSFWPDPRGVTLRQVQALLAGDAPLPEGEALAAQSVAVQGLPALEYVLYSDTGLLAMPGGAAAARACAYATAVAANLARLADELAGEWGGGSPHARDFAQPSPGSPAYRDTREVAAEAVKALSTGLQFARDAKIRPALGASPEKAAPRRAPYWRSGLSASSMRAGVDGMLRFYNAAGLRFEAAQQGLDQTVRHELEQAGGTLAELDAPVAGTMADGDGRRRWTLAALLLGNAKDVIDQNVAPAIGVTLGFNALDGD